MSEAAALMAGLTAEQAMDQQDVASGVPHGPGILDLDEEAAHPKPKNKMMSQPEQPTKKEVDDHNRTHTQFRSWCPPCVWGKTKEDQPWQKRCVK